jgi:hypothetical protein
MGTEEWSGGLVTGGGQFFILQYSFFIPQASHETTNEK